MSSRFFLLSLITLQPRRYLATQIGGKALDRMLECSYEEYRASCVAAAAKGQHPSTIGGAA